jgi:hypothetical protein
MWIRKETIKEEEKKGIPCSQFRKSNIVQICISLKQSSDLDYSHQNGYGIIREIKKNLEIYIELLKTPSSQNDL